MAPITCEHGSYEEWKRDVPPALRDAVHYSTTTPATGFICVFDDGMEHVWRGSAMPATFLADFPHASAVGQIKVD